MKTKIEWSTSQYNKNFGQYTKTLIIDGMVQEEAEIYRFDDLKYWSGHCPICNKYFHGKLGQVKKDYVEHYLACRAKQVASQTETDASAATNEAEILRITSKNPDGFDVEIVEVELVHPCGDYTVRFEKQVNDTGEVWNERVYRRDNNAPLGIKGEMVISRSDIDSDAIVNIAKRTLYHNLDYVINKERRKIL